MAKQRTVSEQVRHEIKQSGLTRYEIAKQSGVEQSALSRFVSGERGLSTSSLDKLAAVLDLEIVKRVKKEKGK